MRKIYFSLFILLSVTVINAQKIIEVQVSSQYDDMEEYLDADMNQVQDSTAGELDYDSQYIELGFKDGGTKTPQLNGFRFDNILIGQSRKITSANIQFQLYLDSYTDTCSFYIFAEDTTNAQTFATAAGRSGPGGPPSGGGGSSAPTYNQFELSGRVKLADSILWTMCKNQNTVTDEDFQTVDISALVQELINKADWDSTNAMAFYISPNVGTRVVESYQSDASNAAKLFISYELSHIDSVSIREDSIRSAHLDSILNNKVGALNEVDYTIPTWTLLKRTEKTFTTGFDYKNDTVTPQLEEGITALISKEMPYNVCMSINENPKTQMGFAWFTNLGIENGEVQIIECEDANASYFANPLFTFAADTSNIIDQYYCNSRNGLDELAGLENLETRSYSSHKALAVELLEGITYAYRVGKAEAWSEIGYFTTEKSNQDTLRFMYMADTQSMNDEYFAISQKATFAAYKTIPDAKFCLMTGDLVESQGAENSEWEWEQWFELSQPVWKNIPVTPVVGNHDISSNQNLTHHFNTANVDFDQEMSTTPGGIYSFVYGDALFIAMSTEDYSKENFLDSLKQYVRDEVEAHADVKWKFVFYHKAIYTGSSSHQSDKDGRTVREAFVPLFDSLGIDMAFQGHDHIYEVMGVTRNFEFVEGSVTAVDSTSEEGGVRANMSGKSGGIFDVTDGTLFFLNCSAGKKKYSPRTQTDMEEAYDDHGITNYWGLFTGKFGQPDLSTFSDVVVTYDTVFVTTYTVDGDEIKEYDSFKVVKNSDNSKVSTAIPNSIYTSSEFSVSPNPASNYITLSGIDHIEKVAIYSVSGQMIKLVSDKSNTIDISDLKDGSYLVKVKANNGIYVEQFIVRK